MQFIEVTELCGVRSAVITFRRAGSALRFVVYPMVHLGEPGFYAEVEQRLHSHDLLVVEGVAHSPAGRALSAAYRHLEGSSRLALVVQRIDLHTVGVPFINPDLTAEAVKDGWRRISLFQRALVRLLVPVYVIQMRLFGTRRVLARHLAVEEQGDVDPALNDFPDAFDELMLHSRDRLLVSAIHAIHQERCMEQILVGVIYGAEHMHAVVDALWRLGYRPCDAEWLTVFDIDPPVSLND
ncbi:hypothetical protein GCM10023194_68740 [Planotetraspora phitsanulokensis]|uniref:Uncharacterized protein n=1 Tax=Planotetraspora phitsanulokensis TaxID=575192 RepID=A0A8J3U6L5_9ACTN|nr:hypothetical protein [Planotetraspora phitsanulokensis]GII39563.1 hypothetical protein Pph01_45660 [Planotetraspora phitsanulokensis]